MVTRWNSARIGRRAHRYLVGYDSKCLDNPIQSRSAALAYEPLGLQMGVQLAHLSETHSDMVSQIQWISDEAGFVTAALDQDIVKWASCLVLSVISISYALTDTWIPYLVYSQKMES
jgi:hypothetical protein